MFFGGTCDQILTNALHSKMKNKKQEQKRQIKDGKTGILTMKEKKILTSLNFCFFHFLF